MKILAIIPARGGSKSVPGKNIKLLSGKPLIAWKIESAKKSKYINRVIVSTDDPEIAEVAREYGAEVPFLRPKEISGDLATDIEFLDHVVNYLRDSENYLPDIIIRLPPTSPLATHEHIDEGIKKLIETPGIDAVRPIIEAPKHPYKMWRISDADLIVPFLDKDITGFDEPHNLPRQLFPKVYIHTGAMDVLWLETLKTLRSTSGLKTAYFMMKPEDSVNIDYPIDFHFAEFLMNSRKLSEEGGL